MRGSCCCQEGPWGWLKLGTTAVEADYAQTCWTGLRNAGSDDYRATKSVSAVPRQAAAANVLDGAVTMTYISRRAFCLLQACQSASISPNVTNHSAYHVLGNLSAPCRIRGY